MALIKCGECGNQVSDKASSCPKCGAPISENIQVVEVATPPKSRSVAIVLALLLGGLGIHRFYLGHLGLGVIYLVLCWTLIPSIIAFIEGIVWLFTSEKSFQEQYSI